MSQAKRPSLVREFCDLCEKLRRELIRSKDYVVVHTFDPTPVEELDMESVEQAEELAHAQELHHCALRILSWASGGVSLYRSVRAELEDLGHQKTWDVDAEGVVAPGWHLWFYRLVCEVLLDDMPTRGVTVPPDPEDPRLPFLDQGVFRSLHRGRSFLSIDLTERLRADLERERRILVAVDHGAQGELVINHELRRVGAMRLSEKQVDYLVVCAWARKTGGWATERDFKRIGGVGSPRQTYASLPPDAKQLVESGPKGKRLRVDAVVDCPMTCSNGKWIDWKTLRVTDR